MKTQLAWKVLPYSIVEFKKICCEVSGASPAFVEGKLHSAYFETYLGHVGAQTMVVEREYVDHDYLEDFASYYVRCFATYRRICTRVHFFKTAFSDRKFANMLAGRGKLHRKLCSDYLGFVVLKPLPTKFIGRTCLQVYDSNGGRRHFPTVRDYPVSLFGVSLSVRTLAFQEQDSVVAACATSALWSAFHGTGIVFQHHIPSPVELTEFATKPFPAMSRAIPNKGLSAEQMALAIRIVGLEPLIINAGIRNFLQANVYAYLRAGIPGLLGVDLHDGGNSIGKHAVAITGFNVSDTPVALSPGAQLRADRIDKIYAHDDQIGPFARMIFQPTSNDMLTTWPSSLGAQVVAKPEVLLVPVYHKIRIPFGAVHDIVNQFDQLIRIFQKKGFLPAATDPEWDIYLSTVGKFKESIRTEVGLDGAVRRLIHEQSLPRYIWRAVADVGGTSIIDIVFDATGIEDSDIVTLVIARDPAVPTMLQALYRNTLVAQCLPDAYRICRWFCTH
jgi:hypothetical protein